MEEKSMTLEELRTLENELASTDFENFKGPHALIAGKPDQKKICELYNKLKPVIGIILSFPLIPPGVKTALRALMGLLDQLCV